MSGATSDNNPPGEEPIPIKDDDDGVLESRPVLHEVNCEVVQVERLDLTVYKEEDKYRYMDRIDNRKYALPDIRKKQCRDFDTTSLVRFLYKPEKMSALYPSAEDPTVPGLLSTSLRGVIEGS